MIKLCRKRQGRYRVHSRRRVCPRLAVWLLGAITLWPWLAQAQDETQSSSERLEVIAHPSVQPDFINRQYLRAVFTLRVRNWPDGSPVTIFVMDDRNELHTDFCREILGTFPYVLRRTWDRSTFTGAGFVPKQVSSMDEMRRRVLSTPGAVGYALHTSENDSRAPLSSAYVLGNTQ